MKLILHRITPDEALSLILSHVDYRRGACRAGDCVENVLPDEVLDVCRLALKQARPALVN